MGTMHHQHDGHSHDHGAHGHKHGAHGHSHATGATATKRLAVALALTGTFMVVEVVAGFITGSLALLSDAGHMLTDAGALVVALFAQRIAQRARSRSHTYGYRRAEVLAALANGVVLGVSSVLIVIEAVRRFADPPEVHGIPMLVVATIGLALNLVSARLLTHGGHQNANTRAAAAHVMADAAGSVAAILAALAVWLFKLNLADPVISIAISLLILWSAWTLVRDALDVLMEGTPKDLDVSAIEATIGSTPGVAAMHDLHVWSVSEGLTALTVHVVLAHGHHGTDVAAAVGERVRERHHIEHVTVQAEAPAASATLVPLRVEPKRS